MDLGDYYSKSLGNFRGNWKIAVPSLIASILTGLILLVGFFEIMTTLSLNLNVLGTAITSSTFSQINLNDILTAVVILLIMEILLFVVTAVKTAATVGMAKQIITEGFSDLGFAWKSGIKYSPRIFVVSIIRDILILIVAIPLILGSYLLFTYGAMWAIPVLLIGSIIFIIGAVLLSLIFFVFNQSIVVGQKSIIDSIKDSFNVFWDNKLTVFLVTLINVVIAYAFGLIVGIVIAPLSLAAGPIVTQVISQIWGLVISIILVPYFALVMTYMYMDLKNELSADEIDDLNMERQGITSKEISQKLEERRRQRM